MKNNILRSIFLTLFMLMTGYYNYSFSQEQAAIGEMESIILYMGDSKVIPVSNPKRVVVNNPAIADVTSVSKEEIFIAAKGTGTTNIIWWDEFEQHVLQVQVFAEDLSTIKQRVDNILKEMELSDVYTRRADSEGKVLLLGSVRNAQDRERIATALETLKTKITDLIVVKEEETMVNIDAEVLELNNDATKTLGFTMPGSVSMTETTNPSLLTVDPSLNARGSLNAIFHVFQWPRNQFTATIDALVQEGKAKILSRPRLTCQSGKEAELLVGGEKPILTTETASAGGASTTVSYKEYGIKLKIKPTVKDNRVKLGLNIEISEPGEADVLGSLTNITAKAYPFTKRNVSTEVYLNNGQTIAIGGLIKQKKEEEMRKTAGLGDLPILGLLFRKKTTKAGGGIGEKGDIELFITLTPKIINEKGEEIPIKESPIAEAKQARTQQQVQPRPPQQETTVAPAKVQETASIAINRYNQTLFRLIRDNIEYPWAAAQGQIEGVLRLSLNVSSTGELLGVKVVRSSGFAVLDENAMSMVKKLAPYPPFPSEINQDQLWVDIPVVYKIKQ